MIKISPKEYFSQYNGGASAPTTPTNDSSTSLEGINAKYGTAPKVTGSTQDYLNQKNHYQEYLDELNKYQAEHSGDSGFDYTKFKLYSDYANNGLKKAQESYDAAVATDNNALNAKAEQANIKDQALKYAQTSLDAQGLGSQGVGASVQAGIGNQYGSNVASIDNEKGAEKNSIMTAYQQEANADRRAVESAAIEQEQNTKNDYYALASEMMNNGVDFDRVKELYGDKLNKEQLDSLTALNDTARGYTDNDEEWLKSNATDSRGMTSYEDFVSSGMRTEDTGYKASDDVSNEIKLLFDNYTAGRENGDVVRLQHHGNGSTNGIYLIYYNGAWYKTDKAHWDSATNRGMLENSRFQTKWNNNPDFESRGTFLP